MVVLVEKRREADLHVVQRQRGAEVIEAASPQRAPELLHLAARRCVVRPGVDQRDAEPLAAQAQRLAAVSAAVVEVERVGAPWRRSAAKSKSSMSASRSVWSAASAIT